MRFLDVKFQTPFPYERASGGQYRLGVKERAGQGFGEADNDYGYWAWQVERLDLLNQRGVIAKRDPIKWVEVARVRNADIEDLLDPDFYLKLVNACYDAELPGKLTLKSITDSNPRIVQRVSAYFRSESVAGGKSDPHRPAAYLLRHHAEFRDEIDEAAMERVGSLFERVNSLLPLNGGPAITNGLETARVLASTS